MNENNVSRKRGPYKRYLKDNSINIPESTIRYRQLAARKRTAQEIEEEELHEENLTGSSSKRKNENVNNDNDHVQNVDELSLEENIFYNETNDEGEVIQDETENCTESEEESSIFDDTYEDDESYHFHHDNSNEDSENNENEIELKDEENSSLYEGSEISKRETELLIIAYCLRNNISDLGMENQLLLINAILPHAVFKSKYKFLQSFSYTNIKEYYFCSSCSIILNFENNTSICEYCQTVHQKSELKKTEHFFFYIPLKEQLMNFVNSKAYLYFRKIADNESDIVNSSVYKQLKEQNVIGINDITLMWNTDGVSLCKSSKISIWPLQVCINELPYRIRRNNIILCGLFYGYTKPDMNVFLEPFAKELLDLCINGFNSTTIHHREPINIKVHTILCSVDSVARPLIQNVRQYNGLFGCSYCFQEGEHISVGRGFARVYCYSKIEKLRTSNDHEKHVRLALKTSKVIKGVKGPSIMALVPNLNIIYSYPPEYMHSCIIGVGKLFGTEWFDSKNRTEKWYLGSKLREFDNRLLAIKPPCEITRTPQSIINNKKYKANDWKYFILYYSLPCLSGLINNKYYKHWFLFVFSLSIFLKASITDAEFCLAKGALIQFVKEIEKLYGKRFMKYNVHVLLHIPMFVKNYGAIWAWSAFPFEHYNGVIKQLFHGTQYIPEQICKLYYRLEYIKKNSYIFNNENCSKRAKMIFLKLMHECKIKNCFEYEDHLRIFGKPKTIELSMVEKSVIELILEETIDSNSTKYFRFIYKNVLFHSCDYNRLIKRNNTCILTENNVLLVITGLVKIQCLITQSIQYIVLGKELSIEDSELCINERYVSSAISFIAKETSNIVCCKMSSILRKCVMVPYKKDMFCIFPLGNTVETD